MIRNMCVVLSQVCAAGQQSGSSSCLLCFFFAKILRDGVRCPCARRDARASDIARPHATAARNYPTMTGLGAV